MLRRSSLFFVLGKNKPTLITFISDVEGCLDYFHNYVSRSRVLQLTNSNTNDTTNTNSSTLTFKPEIENEFNCHFVFGGDAFDKGPGDIRFARQLFSFQDRYPGQVHFILGNRDTNKLKLRTELDMRFREKFVLPQPYYLNEKAHVPYEKFLENEKLNPTSQSILSGKETQLERENILLLKYILKHRMGSGELFEYRRQELALGIKPFISSEKDVTISTHNVTDLEVLNSFKQMSTPGGIYHEYVKRGKLALRVPNSDCVFVHGAINDDSFGLIPTPELQELPYASREFHSKLSSETTQGTAFGIGADASLLSRNSPPLSLFKMIKPSVENAGIVDVDEWFTELNNFKDKEVKDWEESPDFDTSKPNSRRGGASLFGYGHGRCIGVGTSVEVSTFVRKGEPQHIGFNTAVGLNLNGITRVAVGHQPIGDTPLVIAQPGLTTVMGDVSYGDKMHSHPPNGRGQASAEVLFYHYDSSSCSEEEVEENNNNNKTVIHGVTSQGEEYEFTHQADDPFDVSGKRSKDGWWAIGKNTTSTSNQKVLARKTSDSFKTYEQKWFDENEVREKGFVVDFSKAGEVVEGTENGDDDLFYRQGFGQFFSPEYEARDDLKPTALPEKPQVEIKREENEKGGGYFGKNKVKPKA